MTATHPDLDGKSVFITGGGSGIGAALTEGFLRQGAQVAFVGRSDYTDFADTLEKKTGNRPLPLQADITDVDALKGAVTKAAAAHGPIEVLVNNAANDDRHATLEVDQAYWDEMQAINLRAYFFACQAVMPGMREKGGGRIVNFTSASYLMGQAGYPAYVTANAGITGMTRGLAREFGPDGIRVNAIAPGWVLTEKQLEMWADKEKLSAHLEKQCLKEHLEPADIVGPVLFLASESARMMTGQVMPVDGGVVITG